MTIIVQGAASAALLTYVHGNWDMMTLQFSAPLKMGPSTLPAGSKLIEPDPM
jgi:hypothetical protein